MWLVEDTFRLVELEVLRVGVAEVKPLFDLPRCTSERRMRRANQLKWVGLTYF